MPEDVRVHVIYKGRVQGVGFRYTCEGLALNLGLSGWVRNVPNGDVELTVEGRKQAVEALLDQIRTSSVGRHITKTHKDWQSFQGEFSDFRVEFF